MKYIKEKWQQISPFVWGWLQFVLWVLVAISAIAFALVMFDYATESIAGALGTDSPAGNTDKRGTLEFIGLIMGGLLAAIGAIALNRRANAQDKTATAQAENNRIMDKGHIEQRFKSATESLGHEKASVRIAAFYQFYYLAKDNRDPNFRKNIFEILCAHLRETTRGDGYRKDQENRPTEECQTLLNVLFKAEDKTVFSEFQANLQRVHLVGADLQRAEMKNADFSFANLRGVNFRGAKLGAPILMNVGDLEGANFLWIEIDTEDLALIFPHKKWGFFADPKSELCKFSKYSDPPREVPKHLGGWGDPPGLGN